MLSFYLADFLLFEALEEGDIEGAVAAGVLLHLGDDGAEDGLGIEAIDEVDEGEIDGRLAEEGRTRGALVAVVANELTALIVATGLVPCGMIDAESFLGDIDEPATTGGLDVYESATAEVDVLAEGDGLGGSVIDDEDGFKGIGVSQGKEVVVGRGVLAQNDE